MPSVFISYRRDDSRDQAGRLYDHLVEQFGQELVFKDVDSIPLGSDFRAVLTERVAACDVFLAIIGDAWLSIAGPGGIRRLDDPGDFVRIEIEAALGRKIPVIPVLVGSSSVPKAEELPESLRELAYRNAVAVRPNPDFQHDVERLIRGVKAAGSRWSQPWARRVGVLCLAGVLAVLAAAIVIPRLGPFAKKPTPTPPPGNERATAPFKPGEPKPEGSAAPSETKTSATRASGGAGGSPTSVAENRAPTPAGPLPATPATLSSKPTENTSLLPTRLVYFDEFDNPQTGLLKDLNVLHDPNHGQSDGVYFVYAPGGWRGWNIRRIHAEVTCEVVGRVLGEDPRKAAAWMVLVLSSSPKQESRGFIIKINGRGELFLEPNPWPKAKPFHEIDPKRGPIRHAAIKPGNEFNRLQLIVRKRAVEIFVNGVQVCDPVKFDYEVIPAVLEFGVAGPGKKRAEFDRVEIREMTQPEVETRR